MRKKLILSLIIILTLVLSGCSFIIGTTTTRATVTITQTTTTTAATTTTTATLSIDMDAVIAELYNRIYEDLYDDVRAEVIADLTQERFDQIYDQVIADVLAKIETGEISITAESIVDLIYAVASDYSKAVIGVSNLNALGVVQSLGSGVIYKHVGDKYYVVTNHHVVEGASSLEIEFADGTKVAATLQGEDSLVDVAVLYFTSETLYTVAEFGDSDALAKGTVVLAVGNPSGYEFYGSMSMGIVSGVNRYFDIDGDDIKDMFVNYIQHDAAINAGNSGGALFTLDGKIVGINVIKIAATEIEGMGFAIPGNLVAAICADIEVYGVSKQKPVLGITFLDIATTDSAVFVENGYVIPEGVEAGFYIIAISAGATMDGILEVGDILLEIGDITITTTEDFVVAFKKYRVGNQVDVVVLRDGETLTFSDVVLKASVK